MWKSASKTAATTSAISISPQDSYLNDFIDLSQLPPKIADNSKYRRLYRDIHTAHEKSFKYLRKGREDNEVVSIKNTIQQKLKREGKEREFKRKFGNGSRGKFRTITVKNPEEELGMTRLASSERKMNLFLADHRQAVDVEEQTRLTEYYLRDQEKHKSNVSYLQNLELTGKHERVAPAMTSRDKLFKEPHYQFVKRQKTLQIKSSRLVASAFEMGKRNYSYRRKVNFEQAQYIIRTDNHNMLFNSEVLPIDQERRLCLKRIFIQFAKQSEALRVYYEYIEEKMFPALYKLLIPDAAEEASRRAKEQQIVDLIGRITKYKAKRVLHFEDFRQLVETLEEKWKGFNAIETIRKYSPGLFEDKLEQFQQENQQQIEVLLAEEMLPVAMRRLYQNSKHIVAKEYLPLEAVIEVMKGCKIIPKVITMARFMYICLWNKKRMEGFTVKEMTKIQVSLALSLECSMKGIQDYLNLLKLSEFPNE